MKLSTKILSLLTVLSLAGALNAADAPKPPAPATKALKGSVVKVDGTNLVISAGKKADKKEVTVATDAKTVVMIEGKEAKLADLKPGQKVSVTPDAGTATLIEVAAPKAKAKAKV